MTDSTCPAGHPMDLTSPFSICDGRLLNVLVVDDEPTLRVLFCEMLRSDGHSAEAAPDGATALAKFSDGAFDLVITDQSIGVMSGRELAVEIKRLTPGIPMILLTGLLDEQDNVRASGLLIFFWQNQFRIAPCMRRSRHFASDIMRFFRKAPEPIVVPPPPPPTVSYQRALPKVAAWITLTEEQRVSLSAPVKSELEEAREADAGCGRVIPFRVHREEATPPTSEANSQAARRVEAEL